MSTQLPDWFVSDPEGPHRPAVGRGIDQYSIEAYCRRDGQRWPCDAVKEGTSAESRR